MSDSNSEHSKLGKIEVIIILIASLLLIFSFFAPAIFVKQTPIDLDFTKTGPIGDTFGGLMNPFIAIAGVLLTFLAFFIQYKSNKLQRELFSKQLEEQRQQNKKSQFETQFYEMLRLHKENTNELQIDMYNTTQSISSDIKISGRRVFDYYRQELDVLFYLAKTNFPENDCQFWINEAYRIFFLGLEYNKEQKHPFFVKAMFIKKEHKKENYSESQHHIRRFLYEEYDLELELKYDLFNGYSSNLAHYYRHLFQTVKFIANQDDAFYSYEEKRKYLRILRAQLSNNEQVMLFYNWLSNFGSQWENDQNKFFTDYRMIHNINQDFIFKEVQLYNLFDIETGYRKEKHRANDPLFEFQDWE